MPLRITQQSYRPRVSDRIMVGNLRFSQRFKLAQLRELNGVERHRIMKQSAWDQQLGLDSPLRGVFKAVNFKTLRGKRRGWMQSAKFLPLARGGENISLDFPFYGMHSALTKRFLTTRGPPPPILFRSLWPFLRLLLHHVLRLVETVDDRLDLRRLGMNVAPSSYSGSGAP